MRCCERIAPSARWQPYAPRPADARTLLLQRRIDEIYTASPFYGVRRITAQLHVEGLQVNHKAVARHMHVMGLRAIYPGPNLSKRAQQHAVYPYLLRGLKIEQPNQVSEAHFKTMKYRPDYPDRFGTLDEARQWARRFFAWYTHAHYHSGLNLLTPASVHDGKAQAEAPVRQGTAVCQ